ncbi:hypothetical protein B0I35DRAFT_465601 [Stachybotrys elegans]|uniref:Heterokaryon incompatibility domain-containing protein n=1 Tax=Stachybotrys elegans TaxID=80388 RepID=A0A8K0WJ78_9HYPO|nr:hypothetical protein B0I35DRAFT_465601 [Stachybotrys elegans]
MTDHPFLGGRLPYGWEGVPVYWPQRLIHIPSMTSIPRDDSNKYEYGNIMAREPQYSTLSYTWGRWRIKDGRHATPMLPIQNTPWDIPAVEETHFTSEAFLNVVGKIRDTGVEWVWIDVGCIDQRRGSTQAAVEIGRQASIFKQAHSTFVWLSQLKTAQLVEALDEILEHGNGLYDYVYLPNSDVDFDGTMQKLQTAYGILFSDPWFSSLWTLQEVTIRNDAIVLSTEGEPVPWKVQEKEQRTYLTMLINHCQNVYDNLETVIERTTVYSRPLPEQTMSAIKRVKELILRVGFYYLFSTNPNVQYGTARYRTTSHSEDRVYAIMQIYNLVVGKSARPDENPTVEKLVIEFAGAINRQSAILGQLFVHTTQPKPGFSWCITENSIVPDSLLIYRDPTIRATIESDLNGNCVAAGNCCKLLTLLDALKQAGDLDLNLAVRGWGLHFKILLDSHINGTRTFHSTSLPHCLERRDHPTRIECENILVLWLGDTQASWSVNAKSYTRQSTALLLNVLDQINNKGVQYYERLGIVTWTTGGGLPSEPINKISWQWYTSLILK